MFSMHKSARQFKFTFSAIFFFECKRSSRSMNHGLPWNSEAKTATQQNYDTQNAEEHDPYNVPINGISISVSVSSRNSRLVITIILIHWELLSRARRCFRARGVLGLLPLFLITLNNYTNRKIFHLHASPANSSGRAQQREWSGRERRSEQSTLSWFYSPYHNGKEPSVVHVSSHLATLRYRLNDASHEPSPSPRERQRAIPFSPFAYLIEPLKCVCVKHNFLLIPYHAIFENPEQGRLGAASRFIIRQVIPFCLPSSRKY